MSLPVLPPVPPMLAKAVAKIPTGDYAYEPKWDGFRAIIFRDGDEVQIGSRNERFLTRYFPDVVAAVREELPERCVMDGELVVVSADGERLDFDALQQRIHPADSRVKLLARTTPAHFVAFDLLALADADLMGSPFAERRHHLEEQLAHAAAPIHLTPLTTDQDLAGRWFNEFEGAGLDGIVAKALDGRYEPDRRAMLKIKHQRTADCVVAGYRTHKNGADMVGSLLLGLYNDDGQLASVGVCAAFSTKRRRELVEELAPYVTELTRHPWNPEGNDGRTPFSPAESRWSAGKDLSFIPLRPELVVEVRYDHMEGPRFRHTTQFERWRPDRNPASCTYAQLEEPVSYELQDVLGGA